MTDYIVIALLFMIWFQGTRHSRNLTNWLDRVAHIPHRFISRKRAEYRAKKADSK